MKHKEASDLINEIISVAEFGVPIQGSGKSFRYFGFGKDSISITGFENYKVYLEKLEALYELNKELKASFSLKRFEEVIIDLISMARYGEREALPDDVELLFSGLLGIEPVEFEIFRELFGGKLKIPKIHVGDFTIYNVEMSKAELLHKYATLEMHEKLYFDKLNSNVLISVKAIAREREKAIEIADFYFKSFDNVMSYVLADLSHKIAVGIFNFRGHKLRSALSCSKKSFSVQNKIEDRFEELDLEDPHLLNSQFGHDIIWNLITKDRKTGMEKRLINSAEWIGKAVHEKDFSKSLFQFVIAVEGMLQIEKAFVTPSIVSQLSEWLAFIIEENLDNRKSISKYFKEIYRKRSSIAHGGSSVVDIGDLDLALDISKRMITAFLTKSPFNTFKKIDELNDYITELKFR